MRSVNKVILVGNVTRDPEMRQTQSGQAVVTFGIATNREWITSDGRKKTSAEYHEVVAWAQLADICQKYVRKGKLLYVEGYLKTRSWDTPEGIRKFKTEVVIKDMIMLEKKGSESESGAPMFEETMQNMEGMYGEMPEQEMVAEVPTEGAAEEPVLAGDLDL
jgi:single-strand DNA-binding protein